MSAGTGSSGSISTARSTTVADRPGTFSVPVWTADGRTLVYAAVDADGQRLVARGADAQTERSLVPYDGLIAFVVSPDGRRIAFQVLEPERTLPLSVIDVRTGETVEIIDSPIASFFWSPDGERLLYLEPDPLPDDTLLWFRWGVWDGTSSFVTPRFAPSQLISVEYLQFFEQYAQSMRLWSPDSRAFAYPGMSEERRGGDLDPVRPARPRAGPRRGGRLRGVVALMTQIPTERYAMSRRCIRIAPVATATSA